MVALESSCSIRFTRDIWFHKQALCSSLSNQSHSFSASTSHMSEKITFASAVPNVMKLSDLGTQITAFFAHCHHYKLFLFYLWLNRLKEFLQFIHWFNKLFPLLRQRHQFCHSSSRSQKLLHFIKCLAKSLCIAKKGIDNITTAKPDVPS